MLGDELGAIYRDIHADHGVRMLLGTGVEAFEGAGRVERVRTSGGGTIDCDFVVVGVGVQPRTQLAAAAGLDVDDGVSPTRGSRPRRPASSRPATSHARRIRSTTRGSGSSTGPTRSSRAPPPHAR